MTTERERLLNVEGTFNLRDIGGYATENGGVVRWGVVLRGDSPHRISRSGIDRLVQYGLRTVTDLRQSEERLAAPNPLEHLQGVRYLTVSLSPTGLTNGALASLPDLYRAILDHAQPQLYQIFDALSAEDALPALIHCHAGKDRTGVVVALLLGIAGVPTETIAEDYALTGRYLHAEFYEGLRRQVVAAGRNWEAMQPFLLSNEELMAGTLQYLHDHYGGGQRYLERIGISPARIEALRQALTEVSAPQAGYV
jgi:protein-tyrosine phosphatase